MNINELKKFVEEILGNPEGISNIDEVMEKSLDMYRELSQMFLQATPDEREHITEALTDIGKLFEKKFTDLSSKMGMTKEELLLAMQDPKNYTPEVWDSVQGFQKSVEQERASLVSTVTGNEELISSAKKVKKTRAPRVFA